MTVWVFTFIFPEHLDSLLLLLAVTCSSQIKPSHVCYRCVKSHALHVKLLWLTGTLTLFFGSGCSFTWTALENMSHYQMLPFTGQNRGSHINEDVINSWKYMFKAPHAAGYCDIAFLFQMTQPNIVSSIHTEKAGKVSIFAR